MKIHLILFLFVIPFKSFSIPCYEKGFKQTTDELSEQLPELSPLNLYRNNREKFWEENNRAWDESNRAWNKYQSVKNNLVEQSPELKQLRDKAKRALGDQSGWFWKEYSDARRKLIRESPELNRLRREVERTTEVWRRYDKALPI